MKIRYHLHANSMSKCRDYVAAFVNFLFECLRSNFDYSFWPETLAFDLLFV